MGVVRRFIDIFIIIITFPYTPLVYISSFFGSSVPISFSFFYPSSTSKDHVKVNNCTYITITENFTFT